mgnify:CR=1 FL=1
MSLKYTCPSCGAEIITDETTAVYFLLLLSQSGGIIWKIVREIPSRLDSAFFHRQEESRTDFSGCNEKEKIRTERIF